MLLPLSVALAVTSGAFPFESAHGNVQAQQPPPVERNHSVGRTYSVSCRVEANGRIVHTRHEPRDIYLHSGSFAGRSYQQTRYNQRTYQWHGRGAITDALYTEYRELPRLLGRQAFTRIGSTDGTVYVFVQSLGCLFDLYVPSSPAAPPG